MVCFVLYRTTKEVLWQYKNNYASVAVNEVHDGSAVLSKEHRLLE